ncbi:hypothetical protein EDB92DRAFT_1877606, partial [Lactarius akahatsu]
MLHDHGNATLVPAFLPNSLDVFSSLIHYTPHAGESFTAMPPPDSIISAVPASWKPMRSDNHRQNFLHSCLYTESSHHSCDTQSADNSVEATHLPFREPSASNPPPMAKSLTSQTGAVADRRTPSDVLDIPSSPPTWSAAAFRFSCDQVFLRGMGTRNGN